MSAELKRKRGLADALEASKRPKSVKTKPSKDALLKTPPAKWETALNLPSNTQELVLANEINGNGVKSEKEELETPQAAESAVSAGERKVKKEKRKSLNRRSQKALDKETWRISESIGGRMINADPVFTEDEKFLILASRTAINVYSTADSLLTRSIKLQNNAARPNARIISYSLSPSAQNILWVACSDGSVYRIDWTVGTGADQSWSVSSSGCNYMTAASMESLDRTRDIVFTTEGTKDGNWRITANELALPGSSIETDAKTIYSGKERIHYLKTERDGSIIVAYAGTTILIGALRSNEYGVVNKMKYEFRAFQSSDYISSLDIRVTDRVEKSKNSKAKTYPVVDVVVGDVNGVIFLHTDLLQNLVRSNAVPGVDLVPQRLHWHRQAVHTVKFSLDGNYLISGGTETVLVLWQLDTGKQEFLPHLSSTIQNLVVSPSGTSYAIQLADNSAMVISTAELKPTVNVSGIQSCVLDSENSPSSAVRRIKEDARDYPIFQRTPAVISHFNSSRLHVGVGQVQEINRQQPLVWSTPFLQTFDIGTGYNVSRQALTRSNITNVNITPNSHQISEPRVIHMKLSFDGKWLATVDEWMPTKLDLEFLGYQGSDFEVERLNRLEVFLKFWQWSVQNESWELVSRINDPHLVGDDGLPGRILDIAADPSSLRFSTVGQDEIVCTWATKSRKLDGIILKAADGTALKNWHCIHAMPLAKPEPFDADKLQEPLSNASVAFSEDGSILAAAFGGNNNGLLYFLDPDSGSLRLTHTRMYEGDIINIEFLGQDLVTLSDRVLVYDIVLDEMRYSFSLGDAVTSLNLEQKVEMMHLAVDHKSRTFAIALPSTTKKLTPAEFSEVAVFHQDRKEPLLKEKFSTLITALLPAVDSEGYIVLDSVAEIRTILKKGSHALVLAQSTTSLRLDDVNDSAIELDDQPEDDEEMEIDSFSTVEAENEDEDDDIPVVSQQALTEVFDMGPSFALPPMEEMFYQVVNLFSTQSLGQSI